MCDKTKLIKLLLITLQRIVKAYIYYLEFIVYFETCLLNSRLITTIYIIFLKREDSLLTIQVVNVC